MNIAAMAILAGAIALEKLWSRGPLLSRAIGLAFLVLALLALLEPSLLPGLHSRDLSMGGM
jgi:hypothetical protein